MWSWGSDGAERTCNEVKEGLEWNVAHDHHLYGVMSTVNINIFVSIFVISANGVSNTNFLMCQN
jgi:hypothetical protein